MVQVRIPSEVLNVVNFVLLDILLLPYVLFLSSKLAGYANHNALNQRGTVKLVEYKLPAIGGGLVMSPGWYRRFLIAIRLAVLLLVALANLGLEGRTVPDDVTREAEIRIPGIFDVTERGAIKVIGEQIECNEIVNDRFIFGSVIDGECFTEIRDYVSIHEMSAPFVERNVLLNRCVVSSKNCERTMYRCERVDLLCNGVAEQTTCDNAEGIILDSCAAVVYDDDDRGGLMCNSGDIMSGSEASEVEKDTVSGSEARLKQCRHFVARREDIVHWNDTYAVLNQFADSGMVSVFATAYADRQLRNITLYAGEVIVTEISLLWIIPASMTLSVSVVLTAWVIMQFSKGAKAVAHDERGLMRVLGKPVELVRMEDDDNVVSGGGACIVYQ